MQDLILIGRQGSGKGTQGKILAEKFGYQIFETGGALRTMAQQDLRRFKNDCKILKNILNLF